MDVDGRNVQLVRVYIGVHFCTLEMYKDSKATYNSIALQFLWQ